MVPGGLPYPSALRDVVEDAAAPPHPGFQPGCQAKEHCVGGRNIRQFQRSGFGIWPSRSPISGYVRHAAGGKSPLGMDA